MTNPRYLFRTLALAGLVALVMAGCEDTPADPDAAAPYGSVEQSAHTKVNQHRASIGLAPMTFDNTIAAEARAHSRNMASGSVPFSHNGFEDRVTRIRTKMTVSSASENVGFNFGFDDPASRMVLDWLASPGHRTNIEGDYNLTGIGVDKNSKGEYYFTQIFVKRP